MKKISFCAILIPVFLVLLSCGTTENVAQSQIPQTAEEAVSQTQENLATEIADEMNNAANSQEIEEKSTDEPNIAEDAILAESQNAVTETENPSSETQEEETSSTGEADSAEDLQAEELQTEAENAEKVSDEDAKFEKNTENAPTTDERNRVFEYQIFEEPEVIVLDLPEEESEEVEIRSEELGVSEEEDPSPEPKMAGNQETKEEQIVSPSATAVPVVAEISDPKSSETETAEEPATEDETTEPEEKIPPTPSRSVTLKINQYLDVTYPGKGWTYLGEIENGTYFNYFGRKLGTANTTFSLRAKKAGATLLHFYKNDALTGEYIDDYLEVKIEEKRGTGRVKAPSYAEIVPALSQRRLEREANAQNETSQSALPENSSEQLNPKTQDSKKDAESKPLVVPSETSQNATQNEQQPTSRSETQTVPTKSNSAQNQKTSQSDSQNRPSVQSQTTNTESDVKTVIQNAEPTLTNVTQVANEQNSAKTESQSVEYTPTSSQTTQTEANTNEAIQEEPEIQSEQTDPWKRNKPSSSSATDESLLEKAKQDFVDGKFEDALKEAQEYYNNANTRLDEALFLLGQISESNSSVKDIRFAVDSYDMLVKRFPASKLWKDAKNRSIYLKRFYIDIR